MVTPEGPCSQCLYYLGYCGAKTDYWNKKSCDEGISFGYLLFARLMYIYVCIYLVLSFTMKILAGHLRVLCFTKWSNRCCQSSNRQPYHSLMCDSSNKVFLNWKIYVFWITFLNCLLFGKTSHISLIYMPDLTTSVFRDISCVLFDRFMMLNF